MVPDDSRLKRAPRRFHDLVKEDVSFRVFDESSSRLPPHLARRLSRTSERLESTPHSLDCRFMHGVLHGSETSRDGKVDVASDAERGLWVVVTVSSTDQMRMRYKMNGP